MNLKSGIVQGRLTQSPPGQLQWFPEVGYYFTWGSHQARSY